MKGQLSSERTDGCIAVGLRQYIHRPGFQGIHGGLRARLSQRTHNHDRQWVVLHQDTQECESIHARHFQIQREYIGLESYDFFSGHIGVARCSHHFNLWILAQRIGDGFAHKCRVVNDEHSQFGRRVGVHGKLTLVGRKRLDILS